MFKIGNIPISLDSPFFVIAGPCVIEGKKICLDIAKELVEISKRTKVKIIFKASFDKANRSSIYGFRGIGKADGLRVLQQVDKETKLPILTDVHEIDQVGPVSQIVDCLQIPAFLCRQTDLIVACAKTGKPINIKKGQFLSPWDMKNVVEKITSIGNKKILLTERGVSFGYKELVNDMKSIPIMKKLGCPVVFDATHSVQCPGSLGDKTGGRWEFSPILARSGVAAGANGLFVEVHPDPGHSKSDSATIMPIEWLEDLIIDCKKIYSIVRGSR